MQSYEALVSRHLTEVMGLPPGQFSVSPVGYLSDEHRHVFLASPRSMSHGGDLPFVVVGERVMPGNVQALEQITSESRLLEAGPEGLSRFVGLFFLMAEVGLGGPVGAPVLTRDGDVVYVEAACSGGQTGRQRHFRIAVDASGEIAWREMP